MVYGNKEFEEGDFENDSKDDTLINENPSIKVKYKILGKKEIFDLNIDVFKNLDLWRDIFNIFDKKIRKLENISNDILIKIEYIDIDILIKLFKKIIK